MPVSVDVNSVATGWPETAAAGWEQDNYGRDY